MLLQLRLSVLFCEVIAALIPRSTAPAVVFATCRRVTAGLHKKCFFCFADLACHRGLKMQLMLAVLAGPLLEQTILG